MGYGVRDLKSPPPAEVAVGVPDLLFDDTGYGEGMGFGVRDAKSQPPAEVAPSVTDLLFDDIG